MKKCCSLPKRSSACGRYSRTHQITNWFVNHRGRKLKTLRNNRKFTNQIRSKLLLASGK